MNECLLHPEREGVVQVAVWMGRGRGYWLLGAICEECDRADPDGNFDLADAIDRALERNPPPSEAKAERPPEGETGPEFTTR